MTERAVLAVSFGTSHRDTLEKNIAAIEAELAAAFPERTVRRAFTSGMILRKLAGGVPTSTTYPRRWSACWPRAVPTWWCSPPT